MCAYNKTYILRIISIILLTSCITPYEYLIDKKELAKNLEGRKIQEGRWEPFLFKSIPYSTNGIYYLTCYDPKIDDSVRVMVYDPSVYCKISYQYKNKKYSIESVVYLLVYKDGYFIRAFNSKLKKPFFLHEKKYKIHIDSINAVIITSPKKYKRVTNNLK
ncbi:MAG: hypothetical protein Fur0023_17120 [Bacteroidia bacterium]